MIYASLLIPQIVQTKNGRLSKITQIVTSTTHISGLLFRIIFLVILNHANTFNSVITGKSNIYPIIFIFLKFKAGYMKPTHHINILIQCFQRCNLQNISRVLTAKLFGRVKQTLHRTMYFIKGIQRYRRSHNKIERSNIK